MKYVYLVLFIIAFNVSASAQAEKIDEAPVALTGLQVPPEYPGGIKAFYSYISRNFRTPEIDKDMTLKVLISFVVEKDGSMTDIKVLKDPGYGMGAEAVRLIKACPEKWKPGMQNDKVVRASYALPIVMNITGETKTEKTTQPKP